MTEDAATEAWLAGYHAVIVGTRMDTGTVEVIWLLPGGRMLSSRRGHQIRSGRTAPGDAITVFGLTRFRKFSASAIMDAWPYALKLARQLDGDVSRNA